MDAILKSGEFFTDTESNPTRTLLYVGDGVTALKDLKPVGVHLLPPNDGQVYGVLNGVWVPQAILSDDPADVLGYIIGPQRGPNGADLHLCDEDGNLVYPDQEWFDTHSPWKDMVDVQDGLNAMIKIPRYWYKVDTQPIGLPYAGCPRFMISSRERQGFECDGSVFKNSSGEWVDHFLIGKYRNREAENHALQSVLDGSSPSYLTWDETLFQISMNGAGYNLMSYQEWCSVLQLCILERSTFDIYPISVRANLAACQYRGIQEFCYSTSVLGSEFVAGINVVSNTEIYGFAKDGTRSFELYPLIALNQLWNTRISKDPRVANYFLPDANTQHTEANAIMQGARVQLNTPGFRHHVSFSPSTYYGPYCIYYARDTTSNVSRSTKV